jgi:hypothetical protein
MPCCHDQMLLVVCWILTSLLHCWFVCAFSAYPPGNIQSTVPYGGGSVMVWRCISHDCKLDLVTIQGNLTGDQYIRDVLQPVVVPHFDNHPLAPEHVYDGLTCPKYALWDSNPGSWLVKEKKSWFRFGSRLLLLLNDEAWCKTFVSWKQHCIGNGSSYHNRTSDV